jgi:hypothetical protein
MAVEEGIFSRKQGRYVTRKEWEATHKPTCKYYPCSHWPEIHWHI